MRPVVGNFSATAAGFPHIRAAANPDPIPIPDSIESFGHDNASSLNARSGFGFTMSSRPGRAHPSHRAGPGQHRGTSGWRTTLTYLSGVLRRERPNGFGNADRGVALSLPLTTGSMLSAAKMVFDAGNDAVACSPKSGLHHAG